MIKKYIRTIKLIFIIVFVFIISILTINNRKLRNSVSVYDNNFKALNLEKDSISKAAIAYRFDIEQLEYINDSIIKDLNNTRKELQIKDNEILQMQSIKTEISSKDSIYIKDTIFRDSFIRIDTIVSDNWHTTKISLQPSKLIVETKYRSELQVFAKSSKEIIGTPKKCFVGRWFQKKHKVIRVDVMDKNPNAVITDKKFIIIE
jgi:hypothetical protein